MLSSHDYLQARWRRLEASFLAHCVRTFFSLQGVDRAMTIASQAFTALIPLLILVSAFAPAGNQNLVADNIVRRFELTGVGADAVQALFAQPTDTSTGFLSVLLLIFSGVSLTRRLQRMYLQVWQVEPSAGVRASLHAAFGLAVLLVEILLLSFANRLIRELPFQWVLGAPLTIAVGLVLWTSIPWLLLGRQVSWQRLVPGGLLTSLSATAFGFATTIYMPRLMATYSERYGLFGVTLSLVGWLLATALIIVAATVVAAEFDRTRAPWAVRLRKRVGLEPHASGRAAAG